MALRPGVLSKRALSYLSYKIVSQMQSQIVITRPTTPVFSSSTGLVTAQSTGAVIYRGVARLYPVQGGSQQNIGDGLIVMRSTTISVPEGPSTLVRVDDLVTVVSSLDDSIENGLQFRVVDVSMGGVGDPTRKLACTDWEPNSFHTQS